MTTHSLHKIVNIFYTGITKVDPLDKENSWVICSQQNPEKYYGSKRNYYNLLIHMHIYVHGYKISNEYHMYIKRCVKI